MLKFVTCEGGEIRCASYQRRSLVFFGGNVSSNHNTLPVRDTEIHQTWLEEIQIERGKGIKSRNLSYVKFFSIAIQGSNCVRHSLLQYFRRETPSIGIRELETIMFNAFNNFIAALNLTLDRNNEKHHSESSPRSE